MMELVYEIRLGDKGGITWYTGFLGHAATPQCMLFALSDGMLPA
jgi:hypothetical protein